MAKQRDPLRDEAKRLFDEANGEITNREIAVRLGINEKTVAAWKARDCWTVVLQKKAVLQKDKVRQKKVDKKVVKAAAENTTLTEQQITFCLLYTKTYNATQSYRQAYGVDYRTAHSYGYTQLQNPVILAEIKRLQAIKNQALLATAQDVVELHMRIAFADITDFFDFKGLLVTLKNSDEVDGQLISEVKETDQGVSLKLADRQKSLDFLERYFSINPMDAHKVAYDNARLELDRKKAQVEEFAAKVVPIIDDI